MRLLQSVFVARDIRTTTLANDNYIVFLGFYSQKITHPKRERSIGLSLSSDCGQT